MDREEFSYLVWDYLLKPKQHGAQGWRPVLVDLDSIPTVDEIMERTGLSPRVDGYAEVRQRVADELTRLRALVEKYRGRYGNPDPTLRSLMDLSPLSEGVAVKTSIRSE